MTQGGGSVRHPPYFATLREPNRPITPSMTVVKRPRLAKERKQRLAKILRRLERDYPAAECALTHGSAWELLAATILSAQCTDVRVNLVTPGLFAKLPTVHAMASVDQEALEREIQSTGFFRNKAKSLKGAAKRIVAEYGGEVPAEMESLLTLSGVARKTANVVLGTWFGKAEGVVVDTHVERISGRLDLTKHKDPKHKDPKKVEQDLMKILPQEKWIEFSHQLIHHGRQICVARKPRCAECGLEKLCYAKDKVA